tara:strand:- start:523 stop:1776 length:1254 start_codon:yes stop_codon:yes gene_type:complete
MRIVIFIVFILFKVLPNNLNAQYLNDNLKPELTSKVDSLINFGIQKKAFPGAQVIIFKKDSILISKSYGYHTYDSLIPVSQNDLYDLASVTKVLASTLALMKLHELYDLNIKDPASKWIKPLKKSNKRNHSFEQILSHSAGWLPYIAHQNLIFNKKGEFKKNTLSKTENKRFPASVSDSLYVHRRYEKKIFRRIKKTALGPVGEMVYSGMFYFFIPQLVEKMSGLSFTRFLDTHFYGAMKLDRITFLPKSKFSKTDIVPTEQDNIFRKQLVHGWVHDEAASLMGGISGNAGLFSNANSIAPLLQMLLQNGRYQKKQFLKPETINLFSRRTYPKSDNPRGLGFDKPSLIFETKNRYPSNLVSPKTFGHTGYTGTMVWIDPENECFVILLTNRVYPSRQQRGLYELNIRPKLLDYAIQY